MLGLFFFGFLLDPLLGLIINGVYFLVIGSYLTFNFILNLKWFNNPKTPNYKK